MLSVPTGEVIKAWDIAVATMKVGEVCRITCKPEYAYGLAGSPPKIPSNATLVFEVSIQPESKAKEPALISAQGQAALQCFLQLGDSVAKAKGLALKGKRNSEGSWLCCAHRLLLPGQRLQWRFQVGRGGHGPSSDLRQ